MMKYKYQVVYSKRFKKSLKKVIKQGKNIKKLQEVVDKLADNQKLDIKYRNHRLVNNKEFNDCMECHIEPDWLLVYQYLDDQLILLLINTGSHSELFNK